MNATLIRLLHARHLRGEGLLRRDPGRAAAFSGSRWGCRSSWGISRSASSCGGDVRLGGVFATRRRLLHERLLHDRYASERRDDLRPDLLADGSLAFRPLAPTGSTSAPRTPGGRWTRRDLPGGDALGPTRIYAGVSRARTSSTCSRRNGRFGYSLVGDMNAQVAACRTGEARLQAILDRFGYETTSRPARRSTASPSSWNAKLWRRSPTAATGPGLPRQRRPRPRAGPGRSASRSPATDDDRPRRLLASDGGPGQLRLRPDGVRLPGGVQAPDQSERPVDGGTFHPSR